MYTALKPSSGDPATDDSASVADVDIRMEDVDKDMRKIQDKLRAACVDALLIAYLFVLCKPIYYVNI